MCESSKIVPTVTVNCFLHPRHFQTPLGVLRIRLPLRIISITSSFVFSLRLRRYASPMTPQPVHTVPSGQRSFSRYSLAASSSTYCGSKREPFSFFLGRFMVRIIRSDTLVSQVH